MTEVSNKVNKINNKCTMYVTITPFFCTLVSTSVRNIRHHITKASVGSAEMGQVSNSTVLKKPLPRSVALNKCHLRTKYSLAHPSWTASKYQDDWLDNTRRRADWLRNNHRYTTKNNKNRYKSSGVTRWSRSSRPKLTGVLCCDSHELAAAEAARPPTTLPPPTYVHTYTLAVTSPEFARRNIRAPHELPIVTAHIYILSPPLAETVMKPSDIAVSQLCVFWSYSKFLHNIQGSLST